MFCAVKNLPSHFKNPLKFARFLHNLEAPCAPSQEHQLNPHRCIEVSENILRDAFRDYKTNLAKERENPCCNEILALFKLPRPDSKKLPPPPNCRKFNAKEPKPQHKERSALNASPPSASDILRDVQGGLFAPASRKENCEC